MRANGVEKNKVVIPFDLNLDDGPEEAERRRTAGGLCRGGGENGWDA